MKELEQIKEAIFQAVEATFESYLFAEVSEVEESIKLEESVIYVKQKFSCHGLSGEMRCSFSDSLLEECKQVLMFEHAGGDQWKIDYSTEFLNSIVGSMMGTLLSSELYELSLPEVCQDKPEDNATHFIFAVNDYLLPIELSYQRASL